jgi:type IV secretion system protein VirB3
VSGDLRHTTIFRALHRPNLVMGAERELIMTTLLLCAGVGVTAMNVPATIIASAVWLALVGPLRMMAKADPKMSQVYMRSIRYLRYYAPRSRPWREG